MRTAITSARCTSEYEENAEFIKLQFPDGEIDVVVGAPLTVPNFEIAEYDGRPIRVETSAEIIAKKMWHRGDQAKARDLFDLCAVAMLEPAAIEFEQIDARSFRMSFWECFVLAHTILDPL